MTDQFDRINTPLSDEELAAVQAFAKKYGREWKEYLSAAWLSYAYKGRHMSGADTGYCRGKAKEITDASPVNHTANNAARRRYGAKGYPTGWQWWNPGGFAGQAIGIKEAGSHAFRNVMARHGIRVDCGSRYD